MESKNFEVKIYYSSFCAYQLKAKNEDEALKKARKLPLEEIEIFNNLESWQEADNVDEVKNMQKITSKIPSNY